MEQTCKNCARRNRCNTLDRFRGMLCKDYEARDKKNEEKEKQ